MGVGREVQEEADICKHIADPLCCKCVLTQFARLFVTLRTVVHHSPLSMGFPRQEYWSGLPFPPPGDLPDPGSEPASPTSPPLQVDSLPLSHRGSAKAS